MLSEHDRQALLQIARDALTADMCGFPPPVPDLDGAIGRPAGAFVTLHRDRRLRGCIGHVEPTEPLGLVVARCAVAAARSDPRFPAVSPSELPAIEIEISVLGALEPLADVDGIDIGRHGLVVEWGRHRGLLLPQVAAERNWDPTTFLEQTCHKAGLLPDSWRNGAMLWTFEAEVFAETGAIT